jgi:hypothetical protein
MLTYKGRPIRRIFMLWPDTRSTSASFLVETWYPRLTYAAPACSIGADGGIDEILRTARSRGGQILEREN